GKDRLSQAARRAKSASRAHVSQQCKHSVQNLAAWRLATGQTQTRRQHGKRLFSAHNGMPIAETMFNSPTMRACLRK
ncbi:MAG: hypothetical protein WA156_13120, partial [Methylocystis silviterrae]